MSDDWAGQFEQALRAKLAEEIAAAIEDNVRHEDFDKQDRGGFLGFVPGMAYVAGHDKAAEIARSFASNPTLRPKVGEP